MEIMRLFGAIAFLIYVAMIVAGVAIVIAIWRGMKAQERMADAMERIEEIISRDREPRL